MKCLESRKGMPQSAVTAACTKFLIIRCAVDASVSLPCQTVHLTSGIDAAALAVVLTAVSLDAAAWLDSCSCGLIGCGCVIKA